MAKTLLPISELTRSTTIGSVLITGADLVPTYLSGTIGQILKVQPDGQIAFENDSTSVSLDTNPNNDITSNSGLFLDVSQSNVTDTNNIVTGSTGGTTEVTLQTLIDNLSGGGTTQTLSINADQLTISGGNTITLPTSTDTNTFATLVGRTATFITGGSIDIPEDITTTSQLINNGSDGTSSYVESGELSNLSQFTNDVGFITSNFVLTDGQGTTANGTSVDFGGTANTDLALQITQTPVGEGSLTVQVQNVDPQLFCNTYIDSESITFDIANDQDATAFRQSSNTIGLSQVVAGTTNAVSIENSNITLKSKSTATTDDMELVVDETGITAPLYTVDKITTKGATSLITKEYGDAFYLGGGGGGGSLPTPTVAATKLLNVGGVFVEVLEKRVRSTGGDLTLNSGDSGRSLVLPDTDILLEANGFRVDVVVQGQPRFLNDDYVFTGANQIRLDFSVLDTDIIHTTYNIEI